MDTTFRFRSIITAVLAGILGSLMTFDTSQVEDSAQPASPAPEATAFDNATPEQIELSRLTVRATAQPPRCGSIRSSS